MMTTYLLLAAAALVMSAFTTPTRDMRTGAELAAVARKSTWRARGRWLLFLLLGAPIVTAWFAIQSAVYLAAATIATLAVLLASAAALDGRELRVRRMDTI